MKLPKSVPIPNREPKKYKEILKHQLRFFRFCYKTEIPVGQEISFENYFNENTENIKPIIDTNYSSKYTEKQNNEKNQENEMRNNFDSLNPQYSKRAIDILVKKDIKNEISEIGEKVYIFPTLQLPPINYREDEETMTKLLETAIEKCKKIRLASGYLNLPENYQKLLIKKSEIPTELLAASPLANGFHRSGFFKKYISIFYRCFEYYLLKKIKNKPNISLYEYIKPNWTYHGKGAWFYEENTTPSLSIIGSSNYGNFY